MQGKEKVTNRNVKWSTKTFKAISAVHINNNTYYMPLFLSDYFCFPGVMCIYIYIPDSVEGINRETSEIYATLDLRPKRKPRQS